MIYSAMLDGYRGPQAEPLYNVDEKDENEKGGLKLSSDGDEIFNRAFFDENIVGPAVAREIAGAWYKHISLSPSTFTAIDLDDYLKFDRWNLNLSPYKLIRQVSLTLCGFFLFDPISNGLHRLHAFRCLPRHATLYITIIAGRLFGLHSPGCRDTLYYCRGGVEICNSRISKQFNSLVDGLGRLIVAVRELRHTHPRLVVVFQHSSVTVPLYDHAENLPLSLEMWVQRLQHEKEASARLWFSEV